LCDVVDLLNVRVDKGPRCVCV